MSLILKLRASPALSSFRLEKLKRALGSVSFSRVATEYWHFVETENPLDAEQSAVLDALLTYGPAREKEAKGELFLVVPRFGTLSPWASKASSTTSIARTTPAQNPRGLASNNAAPAAPSDVTPNRDRWVEFDIDPTPFKSSTPDASEHPQVAPQV